MHRGWGLAALLSVALVPWASAHDTWLLPSKASVSEGVFLDLTSGMSFPTLESAIRPERLLRAGLRVGGQTRPLAKRAGKKALFLSGSGGGQGVAVAWVELRPRPLELTPAQVEEYLEEIGEAERVGPRWAQRPEPKRWRETYRKLAKAVFRVGAAAADDESWRDPVGLPLEIVPETSPTLVTPGGALSVRVLKGGRPFADFALSALRSEGKRTLKRTDADGRASFVLDRSGPWMLAGVDLRPGKDGDWESDFTTLTILVPEPAMVSRSRP
jgi:hypothetical protein